MSGKNFLLIPILFLILLTVGFASASQNLTEDMTLQEDVSSESIQESPAIEEISSNESSHVEKAYAQENTKIESRDITTYYKENSELVGYLKVTGCDACALGLMPSGPPAQDGGETTPSPHAGPDGGSEPTLVVLGVRGGVWWKYVGPGARAQGSGPTQLTCWAH